MPRSLILLLAACSPSASPPVHVDDRGLHVGDLLTLRTAAVAGQVAGLAEPRPACWLEAPWQAAPGCLRATERDIPWGVERWRVEDSQVRQGWTLYGPVEDHLVVEVDPGGPAWAGAAGALVEDAAGGRWSYEGLEAWDDDGASLPAWMTVDGGLIRLHVDTAEARWPVHIDPVLSQASLILTGQGDFGLGLFLGGDINGDGYGDLNIGARFAVNMTGQVYTYHGSADGIPATPATTWTADAAFAKGGERISAGGDINGDGYDDMVTAEFFLNNVAVFHGSAGGLGTRATLGMGDYTVSQFGIVAEIVPDLENDGYDELVVCSDDGHVKVYHGTSEGVFPVAAEDLLHPCYDIAGAGDMDGDGYNDFAIGSPGAIFVYYGSDAGPTAYVSWGVEGMSTFGASISAAGDVDGDGLADLVVGDRGQNAFFAFTENTTPDVATWTPIAAPEEITDFGFVVQGAGDTNGDGYDDVVASNGEREGRWWLYHGGPDGLSTTPVRPWEPTTYGVTLAGGGDVNGDGFDDIALGAWGGNTVYLIHGCADLDGDSFCEDLDCDDDDPAVHPNAVELCAPGDEDCDGLEGEADDSLDLTTRRMFWTDRDDDGWGSAELLACEAPAGAAEQGGDCDDDLPQVNPGGAEVCGGPDEDCDGAEGDADPGVDPATQGTWWPDADRDGAGDGAATSALRCVPNTGEVGNGEDCDDGRDDVRPGQTEVCNERDDDCDGLSDDSDPALDPATATGWYHDADLDGWGAGPALRACVAPPDHVDRDGDCDPARDDVHPQAVERCDGVDNDCDLRADDADDDVEDGGQQDAWVDADRDGWGDEGRPVRACALREGIAGRAGDCADQQPSVHPEARETCNRVDDDCDLLTDDLDPSVDPATQGFYWPDEDGDGSGDDRVEPTLSCETPTGWRGNANDCDDDNPDVRPGAVERCNALDDDCDDLIDDEDPLVDLGTATSWYHDGDSDGWGADGPLLACVAPPDHVARGGDCAPADAAVHPGAVEVCGGGDEDCDNQVDDDDPTLDPSTRAPYWLDADGDGAGDPGTPRPACAQGARSVGNADDCDDRDASARPGAPEIAADGRDSDCDGRETCYTDADDDGWRIDDLRASADGDCVDPGEATTADPSGDCDDGAAAVNPGAAEVWYDGTDSDCDDRSDQDADMDGFDALLAGGSDCDDNNPGVQPGANEVWYDGVDADCDGGSDYDADQDGYDARAYGGDDCDDADLAAHPGLSEVWYDGLDADCSGGSDNDQDGDGYDSQDHGGADCDDVNGAVHPGVAETWYDDVDADCSGGSDHDQDGDGYEALGRGEDCDDTRSAVNPDAAEVVDGLDNDCDGHDEAWDEDQDELTDLDEAGLGTDPTDPDSDADGLLDGAEVEAGTDPLDDDSDDGGVLDGAEVEAGTDPLDPSDDTSDDDDGAKDVDSPKGCDCDSSGRSTLGWGLLALLALRRRGR